MKRDEWWLRLWPKNRRVYVWILGVYFFNWALFIRYIPEAIAQIIPGETLSVEGTRVPPFLAQSLGTLPIEGKRYIVLQSPESVSNVGF